MTRRHLALLAPICLAACTASRYVTPGGPAPIGAMTSAPVASALQTAPESPMPARIAYAHIQDGGYYSRSTTGVARGGITMIAADDLERPGDRELLKWPDVVDFVRLSPILVADRDGMLALREGAAKLHADILALYTVDTRFRVDDFSPGALGLITLGLAPTRSAVVGSTASMVFVDVRTGFVFGTAEASAQDDQLANAWTDSDAVDQCRRRVERTAYEQLLGEARKAWVEIAAQRRAQLENQPR